MEFLVSTVPEIGKCICSPVKRHTGYLIDYKPSVENLRSQVQKLGTIRDDVKRVIELARDKGEAIKGVVEEWITKVDSIIEEARRLDDEVNENKRCFSGWCPNLSSRYRLGKKAEKMVLEVNSLQQEGEFSVVSDPAPHPSIESIPTGDFVDFESTKLAMNQVIEALKDEEIYIVGVYGLGGVGKTTLMEQFGKQMKKEKLYKEVVKVTVSQNLDLKRIQEEIAEKLGLKINEKSVEARAARLCARLKQEERVLLILDDLWEEVEFFKIGIPHGDDHKGCKIVLTSRSRDVCNHMMSQITINVQVLSYSDSWVLFKRKTGDFVESPRFKTVAMNVVKECGGLPIAIVTLGRALRGKDLSYWNDILVQLKSSIGMDEKLFKSLVISYKALEGEEIKLCFLFCCLFLEDSDISIETLMQYALGEGLYKDVLTLEEARGRVRTSVANLKASCLLLEGNEKGTVKMHDVIRDLAIKISSEDEHKFLVKAGLGLKRWPEREEVGKCHRISLVENNITSLPDRPECPKLRTLILSDNYCLVEIPNNFFEGMKTLVVLDLSYTNISLLPSSLSCLINLRTLCLQGCGLMINFSLLGELKKLEILRLGHTSQFMNTGIHELPEEIGELTNLKLLDLECNCNLKIVPPNVISRLTFLEELYMHYSFSKWELQGKGPGRNASFAEVALLPYLTVLHIDIDDTEILSQEIFGTWGNLREFYIRAGIHDFEDDWDRLNAQGRRCMDLDVSGPLANWVKELAERTEDLYLTAHDNFDNGKPLFNSNPNSLMSLGNASTAEVTSFPFLTVLRIHIIDVEILSQECFGPMRNLREFYIRVGEHGVEYDWERLDAKGRHCMDLHVSGPLANWVKELGERTEELSMMVHNSFEHVKPLLTSLPCLTALCIDTEDMEILSQDIFGPWRNLSEFYIRVGEHDMDIWDPRNAQNRRCMDLQVSGPIANWVMDLVERTEELYLTVHSSFENVVSLINRNPSCLKSLIFEVHEEREHLIRVEEVLENALGSLESLKLCNMDKLKKLCEGPMPSGFFGNLRSLEVMECNNLRHLLSLFPGHTSRQLESLVIFECEKMEGLISREEAESAVMEGIASPILSESHTRNSPKLLPPRLTFQNLRKLDISWCPSFKYIFTWKLANGLNQLEELELWSCDGMEVIIAEEEEEVGMVDSRVLPRLKTLKLQRLGSLVNFFKGEVCLDMASLEVIVVDDCENLRRLPLGPQSAPNLRKFIAQEKWFEELEWGDESITKSRLQPLFKAIRRCWEGSTETSEDES